MPIAIFRFHGRFILALDSKNLLIRDENSVQPHDSGPSSHELFSRITELRALGTGTTVGMIVSGNPGEDIELVLF